jgi:hypothetical protein
MIELSSLRDIVAIVGVLIALGYYILTLRNQKRTRQAQLLMNLYEKYSSEDSREKSMEIQKWQWDTLDEFFDKYGNKLEAWSMWESKAAFFHGIGVLLEADMIEIKLLDRLLTNTVNRHWNVLRMGQVLAEWRKRIDLERGEHDYWTDSEQGEEYFAEIRDTSFYGFDYLYDRLTQYRKQHPIRNR